MQAISSTPPSALPPQRAPELAESTRKAFNDIGRGGAQSEGLPDAAAGSSSGGNARSLQNAETEAQPRPPAIAPEREQASQDNDARPDQRATTRDSILDRARAIINQFDVGNLTEQEFTELRATLEPLGIGRGGRNLVDISA